MGSVFLDWDETPGSGLILYSSFDLRNWTGPFLAANPPGATTFGLDLTDTIEANPELFFRGATVDYDRWPSTERPLNNANIELFFDDSNVTLRYTFDSTGAGGEWRLFRNGNRIGRGDIREVDYQPVGPYAARLTVRSEGLATFRLVLHYDLDGVTFTTTNPSRMSGDEIDESGEEPVLVNSFTGRWSYVR